MQAELALEATLLDVQILGVNEDGHQGGNAGICAGRTIPWLQDLGANGVWSSWGVGYRDVYIVDETNRLLDVYNLTTHNLQLPSEYEQLKALLRTAANP
jgi:hypothetical protein